MTQVIQVNRKNFSKLPCLQNRHTRKQHLVLYLLVERPNWLFGLRDQYDSTLKTLTTARDLDKLLPKKKELRNLTGCICFKKSHFDRSLVCSEKTCSRLHPLYCHLSATYAYCERMLPQGYF